VFSLYLALSLFLAAACVNWKKSTNFLFFFVFPSLFRTFHNCCRRQQEYYCGSTAPSLPPPTNSLREKGSDYVSVCVGKKVLYLLLWFLLAVWYLPEVRALKFLVQHFSAPAGAFMCVCAIIKTPSASMCVHGAKNYGRMYVCEALAFWPEEEEDKAAVKGKRKRKRRER